ncbi:MAG: response regulator [Bacteroidetes bacterium]|nr:response regulator [Bacteroidota bacterium]
MVEKTDQQESLRFIRGLGELYQQIGPDPEHNIDIIVTRLQELLHVSLSTYTVFDRQNHELIYRVLCCNGGISRKRVSPEGSICYETIIMRGACPACYEDLDNSEFAGYDVGLDNFHLGSFLGYPVMMGEEVLGALCVGSQQKRQFSEAEKMLLQTMAKIVAVEEAWLDTKNNSVAEQSKYKVIFDLADDAFILTNTDLTITEVNRRALEMFDCTREQMIGEGLSVFSPVNQPDGVRSETRAKGIYLALKAGEEAKKIYWKSKAVTGAEFESEVSFCLISQDKGDMVQVIIRDITRQMETERNLIEARKRAEEADRLKSAFLANMSHEIRTPLNSIIGFSELIMDEDTEKEEKENFLGLISSAGRTLLQLIDDIIDISKIEAGQVKISKSKSELNQILDELKINYEKERDKRGKHHIELRMHKAYSGEFYIMTDPFRFRQIMMNLLSNALKFIDSGFIEFGYTEMSEEQVQFYVKDTGIGIEKDKSHLIFQRFGQVDSSYKRNLDGTGLGLAITHNLVGLLGGKIWFDSEPEKGTTFYFTLPASHDLQRNNLISVNYGRIMYDWSDKVFLVVDDVEANFLFLKAVFRDSGALLLWAKDGLEAVRICRNNSNINLVLMDIRMPELDGYNAVKKIRQFAPKLPIIAQTAFAGQAEEQIAIQQGCQAYISKPISKTELASLIKKLLEEA